MKSILAYIKKNISGFSFCVLMLALLVFGVIDNHYKKIRHRKEAILFHQYVFDHKCVRTGFAGKDAKSVYQCDNGIYLYDELYSLANPEINN